MNRERLVKSSKYLSYHLRHHPEKLGLKLAPGGWVEVETLLKACSLAQFPINCSELD